MRKWVFKLIIILVLILPSCVSLKSYERVYVDDPEMEMGSDAGKIFSNYVFSIREGATPAGSKQASGGCGCK